MTISSNLAAQPLLSVAQPSSSASEAQEVRGAPDRDGDSDDRASLSSHQGTKIDVSA